MWYQHLFFDLDRTLWDFETNSHVTLTELYTKHELAGRGIPDADVFIKRYKEINEECWAEYREGRMTKEVLRGIRFRKALEEFGVEDEPLAEQFGLDYIAECPLHTALLPKCIEVLQDLQSRFKMHIITNGFNEVQHIKLRESGLTSFFEVVVISELVGEKKPHPKVFEYALAQAGADPKESLMIGDDLEVDVLGAQACGIDGVYFNPNILPHTKAPKYEISQLAELLIILTPDRPTRNS